MVDDKPSKCWDKIDPQNAGFLSITIVEMNHENGGFDQRCVEKFNTIKVGGFCLKSLEISIKTY